MLQEGDGLWAILEKIQTEQVGGLTVDDIDFPGDIKERTYGNSRGCTHNLICSWKNLI